MRSRLILGNWKMNGGFARNAELMGSLRAGCEGVSVDVGVCVPFPYLAQAQAELSGSGVAWGGQNVSEYAEGAYTGEVSAGMLREFGAGYVLVGHSERRALFGENDQVIAAKFQQAVSVGLVPVLCLGETLAERQSGNTLGVVRRQLEAVIDHVGIANFSNAVIAYEPVWAIGTGVTATPLQAQEVHAALRSCIAEYDSLLATKLRILYGGSVKAEGAAALFLQADIDGGLIGGASLVASEFLAICRAAAE